MPYLIVKDDVLLALWYSIGFTSFVLLVFGAAKTWYTGAGQGKGKLGILVGAVWTLGIAATAAACAFGLVSHYLPSQSRWATLKKIRGPIVVR